MTGLLHDVITGRKRGLAAAALKLVLSPFCLLYIIGVSVARWGYSHGLVRSYALGKPVISIGNITAGGTGKTPFSVYLAKKIILSGKRPAILMRGYMSCGGAVSDEEQMVKDQLAGIIVRASPDRVRSAQESLEKDRPDIFILDDGFQHWKIRRDLEIVLVDAINPFGNGWPLPLGLLREPKSSLKRADIFVITRADLAPDRARELGRELGIIRPQAVIAETAHVPVGTEEPLLGKDFGQSPDLASVRGRICACSAIGSPEGFASTLENLGAEIMHHDIFRDHHVYTADDVRRLVAVCRSKKVDRLVTTQKDVVKLIAFKELFCDIRLIALVITIKVLKGENEISSRLNSLLHS